MSYIYNKIMSSDGNDFIIQRIDEQGNTSYIPADSANSDYQRYLRWLNGEEENGTIS